MAAYATTDDVAARWRPLSTAEETVAETLLEDAALIIRARFPDIDARLAADTLDPSVPRMVSASMVQRAMRNPDGLTSVTIDDSTRRWDNTGTPSGLYLTTEEADLLGDVAVSGTAGAFTIVPYGQPDPAPLP